MTERVTKDSGKREEYASGMKRDTQEGKARFDLVVPKALSYEESMLTRWAIRMAQGAEKYDPRNWEKGSGQEELERAESSAFRHFMQWLAGETDEDHAAAVFFNIQAAEYFRWRIADDKEKSTLRIDGPIVAMNLDPNSIQRAIDATKDRLRIIYGMDPATVSDDLRKAPELPKFTDYNETDEEDGFTQARAKHRANLDEWHGRSPLEPPKVVVGDTIGKVHIDWDAREMSLVPDKEVGITITPGPPATPEDRKVGEEMLAYAFANEQRRLDEWAQYYGDEIVDYDGFRDVSPYDLITRARYLKDISACTVSFKKKDSPSRFIEDCNRIFSPVDGEGC